MKRVMAAAAVLLLLTTSAGAEEKPKVSGFLDVNYRISDEPADTAGSKNAAEDKFIVQGEIDIASALSDTVEVRADLDIFLNGDQTGTLGGGDSAGIEQAFFLLKDTFDPVSIMGGAFNNPVGWEAEDAPGLHQVSHGQLYRIFDASTALYGNNVNGLAFMGNMGKAALTVALVDDLARSDEENSTLAVFSYTLSEGVDIEIGYVSQAKEKDTLASTNTDLGKGLKAAGALKTTLGDIIDVNMTFKTLTHLIIAVEYLTADEVVDAAWGVTANLAVGEKTALTLRYDSVGYEDSLMGSGRRDSTSMTGALTYRFADNLRASLEYRKNSDDDGMGKAAGIMDGHGSQTMLQFVANF